MSFPTCLHSCRKRLETRIGFGSTLSQSAWVRKGRFSIPFLIRTQPVMLLCCLAKKSAHAAALRVRACTAPVPLQDGCYWQLVAVDHAGRSQPGNAAIQTAIPGLAAAGDAPLLPARGSAQAIAAPGLASAARANLVATDRFDTNGNPVACFLVPAGWRPLIKSRLVLCHCTH